jgi:hypothetical protein
MLSRPRLAFVQEKIMELQQALFFNKSEAVLKFPTSIINALHVDDVGHVWFMVKRPSQKLSEFEREFFTRLEFYKKGKGFYLHVSGKSRIILDPEEINGAYGLSELIRNEALTTMALIKMKIEETRYYPCNQSASPRQKKEKILPALNPSAFFKSLQYIVKDIIPVFQSH